jgi:hypothetical protein
MRPFFADGDRAMRPRRWLAWKFYDMASWLHVKGALWLSWEQGQDHDDTTQQKEQ